MFNIFILLFYRSDDDSLVDGSTGVPCSSAAASVDTHGCHDDASSSGYLSYIGGGLQGQQSYADSHVLDDNDSCSTSDESEWDEDEWPSTHPLPLPLWGCERPELVFATVVEYMHFLAPVTQHLQDCISSLPYDTLSTFVE